jgi:hypothetical protein
MVRVAAVDKLRNSMVTVKGEDAASGCCKREETLDACMAWYLKPLDFFLVGFSLLWLFVLFERFGNLSDSSLSLPSCSFRRCLCSPPASDHFFCLLFESSSSVSSPIFPCRIQILNLICLGKRLRRYSLNFLGPPRDGNTMSKLNCRSKSAV